MVIDKNSIPKETETIAARRAVRLAEKLKKARENISVAKAWWSNAISEMGILLLIFLLNFYLIYPFFGTTAPDNTFSGPVMPLLIKLVELFGVEVAYAIQIVNIFFFLALPFSFYLFIRSVTERKLAAVLAALFITLPFYPFAQIRVSASLQGNDAAHIASLVVVPIALLGLFSFVRKGGAINLIIASLASATVALISPFGFMTYLIFAFISTFSEVLLGRGRLKMFRFGVVLLFTGGLNSFWYNPAFFSWMIAGPMGGDIRATVLKLIPISFFVLPVLGVFGYLLFDRKPVLQPVFLASFYTMAFLAIAIAGGGVFPSHPSRYAFELGMSLAFLLSIVIVRVADFFRLADIPRLAKLKKQVVANTIIVVIVLLLVVGVIIGKNRLSEEDVRVLGIWDGVEKGEIWQAKDRFGGVSLYSGYAITGLSILGLGTLGIRNKIRK